MSEELTETQKYCFDHFAPLLEKIDSGSLKLSENRLNTADDAEKYVTKIRDTSSSLYSFIDLKVGIQITRNGMPTATKRNVRIEELEAKKKELLRMTTLSVNDFTRDKGNFTEVCEKCVGTLEKIRNAEGNTLLS